MNIINIYAPKSSFMLISYLVAIKQSLISSCGGVMDAFDGNETSLVSVASYHL